MIENDVNNSSYDKFPFVDVPGPAIACVQGWDRIAERLAASLAAFGDKAVLAVECYPGVDEIGIASELDQRLASKLLIRAADAMLPPESIDELVAPFLGADDPVFGFLSGLQLPAFFDQAKLDRLRQL